MSTLIAKPRTKTPTQIANERYDMLVKGEVDKGWKIVSETPNQEETVRALTAAAKRLGFNIRTNVWDNGKSVTFKVWRKNSR